MDVWMCEDLILSVTICVYIIEYIHEVLTVTHVYVQYVRYLHSVVSIAYGDVDTRLYICT